MAKIKHTKNELKRQRDALGRFERFLPTLQLKKQQLQLEVRTVEARIEKNEAAAVALRRRLAAWVQLYCEPLDFDAYLTIREIRTDIGNVAGVNIPTLEEVVFERLPPDLFATPAWTDDGIDALEESIRLRCERRILDEQQRLLSEELRVTSQRVNLFEKVKIPEAREHIRVIRIFLGDQQTAEIARSKIAKSKPQALVLAE